MMSTSMSRPTSRSSAPSRRASSAATSPSSPSSGVEVGPDELKAAVLKEQVKSAPDLDLHGQEMSQSDESALYHHFEMNYTAIGSDSGRRLARR